MKIIHLLFLLLPRTTFAGAGMSTKDTGRMVPVAEMTKSDFNLYKKALSKKLRIFVDDFAKWPKSDRSRIFINRDLVTVLPGLSRDRQYKYDGNLAFWIEIHSPLLVDHEMRVSLVRCLSYLKLKE